MTLYSVVFAFLFLSITCIFGLIVFLEVLSTNNLPALQLCTITGTCVGGSVHAITVEVLNPVQAENIKWVTPPVQRIATVQSSNGTIILESFVGSNILITANTVSLTEAVVTESFVVLGNATFGSNTSCVRPVSSSCLNISSQGCSTPLLASCLPNNAAFEMLNVRGSLYIENTNITNNGMETPVNIVVQNMIVDQDITITQSITCTGNGAFDSSCINIAGYNCNANGPLDASCIPASLPFYDVTVDHVLNATFVQCLGPPMDVSTCYGNLSFSGNIDGNWLTTRVQAFQDQSIIDASPFTTSTLAWSSSNTQWEIKTINALDAEPQSIMLRDVNGNTSAATLITDTATIQGIANGSQCIGLGQTITETTDSHIFYMFLSSEHGSVTAYNGPLDTLFSYNSQTQQHTWIGMANGGGTVFSFSGLFAIHPNGILYAQDSNNNLFQVDKTNAFMTQICVSPWVLSGIAFKGAFDYYGNMFTLISNGTLICCDLTTCSCTSVKRISPFLGKGIQSLIIGSVMYVFVSTSTVVEFDIRSTTSTTAIVHSTVTSFFLQATAAAAGIFAECANNVETIGAFHFVNNPVLFFPTATFDPQSFNVRQSQFTWVSNDSQIFFGQCNPVSPTRKCYYPWGSITSRCFTPYQDIAGTCMNGNLTLENHSITTVDGLFASDVYPNLNNNNNSTINIAANLDMGSNKLVFLSTDTNVSMTGSTLTINSPGEPNTLYVTNLVQARRFVSPIGGISLSAGPGAGLSVPATLTANNAAKCRWQVSITTTSSPAINSVIFHVTIAGQTQFAPGIVFSAVNQNSAQLTSASRPFVTNETLTGFDFMSGATALTALTNYQWNFQNCI